MSLSAPRIVERRVGLRLSRRVRNQNVYVLRSKQKRRRLCSTSPPTESAKLYYSLLGVHSEISGTKTVMGRAVCKVPVNYKK